MQQSVKTIVIRCPNWVGDIVMAIPVFDCFRQNFPDARIIGVLRKNAQGIVRDGPWFDDLIDCEDKTMAGLRRMTSKIRALGPDMAILLPNSVRSAIPFLLTRTAKIYGYRRNLRSLLISGGPKPLRSGTRITPVPMQEYYLEICRWLGLTLPSVKKPRLFIGQQLQKRADELLLKYGISPNDMVIGLNPGASFGSSKCWPAPNFAKTAELFQQKFQTRILLLAGPGEEQIVEAILSKTSAKIINTAPDRINLELLKPIVKRCDLLITNDTGPRHYAVALDVPAVVIMGPTDPRYTESNLDKTIVIRIDMDCSPCHKKICPTDHKCMTQITPEMVFEAGKKLLNGQK
jgi:heptosyltransferase II